jgi:predicted Zn-dependent peptidase
MNAQPNIHTLKNGLKVVYVPFKGAKTVAFYFRCKAGSMFEKPNEIGVSHFLEHMLLEGTQKYPLPEQIKNFIPIVGGKVYGVTSRENSYHIIRLLKEDYEKGFEFLSEIIINPQIKKEAVNKQKNVIKHEIQRFVEAPEKYIGRLSFEILFPGERLAKFNTGNVRDVERIDYKTLLNFYNKYYGAKNCTIAVAGDLDNNKVFQYAEKYFSKMPSGREMKIPKHKKNEKLAILVENRPELKQTHVKVDYHAYTKYNPKKYALHYLAQMLGTGRFSRLHERAQTQKGLAYLLSSGALCLASYGLFGVYTAIDERNLVVLFKLLKEELKDLSSRLISPQEFEKAQNLLIANVLFTFEKIAAQAEYYSDTVLWGQEDLTLQKEIDNYKKVTREEILQVAREMFAQEPKITVMTRNLSKKDVKKAWQNA